MSDIARGFHVLRDEGAWLAVGPTHFTNIMESTVGYGDTPEAAVGAWRKATEGETWWRDKAIPEFTSFMVHA